MLKRLIQWIQSLFSKPASNTSQPVASAPSQTSPVPASGSTKVLSLETQEGWEAYRNSFVPSTRAFVMTWEQKLERDKQIASNTGPAVDRDGFILNAENGWIVTPRMNDGQTYQFIAGKAGTVVVFGVSGNQLRKVNGQAVARDAEFPVGVGLFNLAVESVNGYVGVRIK